MIRDLTYELVTDCPRSNELGTILVLLNGPCWALGLSAVFRIDSPSVESALHLGLRQFPTTSMSAGPYLYKAVFGYGMWRLVGTGKGLVSRSRCGISLQMVMRPVQLKSAMFKRDERARVHLRRDNCC